MSGGENQYGSAGAARPSMMNMGGFQQRNFNPTLQNAMNYGQQRANQMPSFMPGQPGLYGRAGSQPWPSDASGNPVRIPPGIGEPGGPPLPPRNPRRDFPQWPGTNDAPMEMNSGLHPHRQQLPSFQPPVYSPNLTGDSPAVGSPPSAFGIGQAPSYSPNLTGDSFQNHAMPTLQVPQGAGYVGQSMSQPAQPTTAQQANAFSNSIASFQNPMGLSQQQLGPSFNPAGSAMGGYFQGNRYVPNVGNARNGLDTLARFGMGINGTGY